MRYLGLLVIAAAACGGSDPTSTPPTPETPVACGHAHNDYEHPRPLADALDAGMCSVEADIFLEAGALLVAHEPDETDPSRTLQSLYLDPLRAAPPTEPLLLLIDVKSDATTTYAALHDVLADYADILTQWDGDRETTRAVTAVITGERDRAAMEAQSTRFAAMDGRLADLDDGTAPVALIPLVSDNWIFAIGWLSGPVAEEQQSSLDDAVAAAHDQGRRLRFWASPDSIESWQLQLDVGVDLINTDDLSGLSAFLAE